MRHLFGRNRADWVMEAGDPILAGETIVAYEAHMLPSQPITVWDEITGGEQVTDLVDPDTGDSLGSSITTDGYGNIPRFLGPDGVTYLWASASVDGESPRYAMTAVDAADATADITDELTALDDTVTDHGQRLNWLEQGRVHDVTTYGATGDGSADDTAAIQAALDQVRDDDGGVVVVPGGTYSIQSGPLRMYSHTRWSAAPDATIRRDYTGKLLINGDSDQDFGGYTGHGDLLIEGGTWDANGGAYMNNAMVFSIGHARNVTIRDLTVLDVPGHHAVELNSTLAGRILNCCFLGFLDTGTRAFSEAVQIDGAYRASLFGGFGPYDHTPSRDILMEGCHVGPSDTAGSWGRGVGSHSTSPDNPHTDIRITNNHFEDTGQFAVGGYCWQDSVISGNTIRGCGAGVWVRSLDSSKGADQEREDGTSITGSQPLTGVVITSNMFSDLGSYEEAVLLQGEDTGHVRFATVDGNTVSTSGVNGTRFEYVDESTITGNVIIGAGGTSISTDHCDGLVIDSNRIRDGGGAGITLIDSVNGCVISNNSVRDVGANGLWAQGGQSWLMSGNTVVGAGQDTSSTSYGIRITTNAAYFSVVGNRVRKGTGDISAAISITSSCDSAHVFGNDCRLGGGTLDLQATNLDTTSNNLS